MAKLKTSDQETYKQINLILEEIQREVSALYKKMVLLQDENNAKKLLKKIKKSS